MSGPVQDAWGSALAAIQAVDLEAVVNLAGSALGDQDPTDPSDAVPIVVLGHVMRAVDVIEVALQSPEVLRVTGQLDGLGL